VSWAERNAKAAQVHLRPHVERVKDFDESQTTKMNSLRVYINPASADALDGQRIFYSRRADGPYYRWFYEEERWRGARVRPSDSALRTLCMTSWKTVPTALQTKLSEHYLE
jgi:hypothetical protein